MRVIPPDTLVPSWVIRRYNTIGSSTLRVWVFRGKLVARGTDEDGAVLFRWGDVQVLLAKRASRCNA